MQDHSQTRCVFVPRSSKCDFNECPDYLNFAFNFLLLCNLRYFDNVSDVKKNFLISLDLVILINLMSFKDMDLATILLINRQAVKEILSFLL
jgi:hypothetical protein